MNTLTMAATVAARMVAATAGAQSQNDARSMIGRKADVGNRLTVTRADGTEAIGRLVRLTDEDLVLQQDAGERTFRYAEIDQVRKRKNGVLLGALIGLAAGAAVGWPLAELSYNEGGSRSDGIWIALGGLAAGVGVDALLGSNPTIYRSSARSRVTVQPTKNGAVVGFSARW